MFPELPLSTMFFFAVIGHVPLELTTTQPSMSVKDKFLFSFDLLLIWAPMSMFPWGAQGYMLPGFHREGLTTTQMQCPLKPLALFENSIPCQESNHPQTGTLLAKQMDKGDRQAKAHG